MNGLAVLLLLVSYLILALMRSSLKSYGLILLLGSKFSSLIIGGFTFSEKFGSIFGQANTVVCFLLILLCFFEAIFFGKKIKWERRDLLIFVGISILGFGYLFWQFYSGTQITISDFAYILTVLAFFIMRPDYTYLKYAPWIAFFTISILFGCAIAKYQNPYLPYFQTDYGIDGPYHNFMWDIFGLTERYRGPFLFPNVLAYTVVFIAVLSASYKSRLTLPTLLMSFTVLLLSGSRFSIFALSVFIIFKYFILNWVSPSDHHWLEKNKFFSRKTLAIFSAFVIFIAYVSLKIVQANPTINGRTINYLVILNNLKGNYILGAGITNGAENTYLTILGAYGLVGLISMILIFSGLFKHLATIPNKLKMQVLPIFFAFFIASMGESLLNGGPYEIGLFYIFLILVHREPKEMISKPSNS